MLINPLLQQQIERAVEINMHTTDVYIDELLSDNFSPKLNDFRVLVVVNISVKCLKDLERDTVSSHSLMTQYQI
jgi:hypothetical protein